MTEGDENVQNEIDTLVQLQCRDYCPLKINVRHTLYQNRTSSARITPLNVLIIQVTIIAVQATGWLELCIKLCKALLLNKSA